VRGQVKINGVVAALPTGIVRPGSKLQTLKMDEVASSHQILAAPKVAPHPWKSDDNTLKRGPPAGDWQVTMHDDFETFNASLWTKGWSWCNGTGILPGSPQPRMHVKASDMCYFADENVHVADGKLVLTNKREQSHGFNYTSGVVNSIRYGPDQGFAQTYGYFEARIKASPGGRDNLGMCPAFWMPNVRNNGDDGNCEIDVMEIPGNPKFSGGHTVWGTVHATHDSYANGSAHGQVTMGGYFSQSYHDFAVLWEPGFLAWYIDGTQYFNTTQFVPDTA
jgi:beta-glucanase (GH16 family)